MLKEITIPNLEDPVLAYETGVHIGDGCLSFSESNKTYGIYYSGNLMTDSEFFEKTIPDIIWNLYRLKLFIEKIPRESSIRLRVYSKSLFEFKRDVIGLPVGNKSIMKSIPSSVFDILHTTSLSDWWVVCGM